MWLDQREEEREITFRKWEIFVIFSFTKLQSLFISRKDRKEIFERERERKKARRNKKKEKRRNKKIRIVSLFWFQFIFFEIFPPILIFPSNFSLFQTFLSSSLIILPNFFLFPTLLSSSPIFISPLYLFPIFRSLLSLYSKLSHSFHFIQFQSKWEEKEISLFLNGFKFLKIFLFLILLAPRNFQFNLFLVLLLFFFSFFPSFFLSLSLFLFHRLSFTSFESNLVCSIRKEINLFN